MWRKVANISASIRPAVCQQKPSGLQPAPAPWQQDAWQPENGLPAEEEWWKSPQSLAAQEVHHPRWHYASQSLWRKGHNLFLFYWINMYTMYLEYHSLLFNLQSEIPFIFNIPFLLRIFQNMCLKLSFRHYLKILRTGNDIF